MAFYNTQSGVTSDITNLLVPYAVFDDRPMRSCGDNSRGQLGINSTTSSNYSAFQAVPSITGVKQIALTFNGDHTFALKTDGTLLCCGYNNNGCLGLNNATNYSTFQTVPSITGIKQVACGYKITFALKTDGTLLSCGYNKNGQLGLNVTTTSGYSTFQTVPGITGIKQIACGYTYAVALKNDGTLLSCGRNNNGQLGINSTTSSNYSTFQTVPGITGIKQIACGLTHTFALKTDGTLLSCGDNSNGQLGLNVTTTSGQSTFQTVPGITGIKQIACGYRYAVALKTNGTLLACGANGQSQLGLGNTTQYSTFQTVPSITGIKQIACGHRHTIALKTDGTLLSTGYNQNGQLGINSTTASNYSTFQTVPGITGIKQIAGGKYMSVVQ